MRSPPEIAFVVPCYNEEEALPETFAALAKQGDALASSGLAKGWRLLFVDDGSVDGTWACIRTFAAQNSHVDGIKLSRNCGHQNALLCGLMHADADVAISIDADLQDDISVIGDMLQAYRRKDDIVFGVRTDRSSDGPFKRVSAHLYYRLLRMMGTDIVYNHADFRLMSRRTIDALRQYGEVNLFLRGIVPQLGFRHSTVFYTRQERTRGISKYPLRKMMSLALDGITSFSVSPLHAITVLGLLISFAAFVIGIWALFIRIFSNSYLWGWASTVIPMYFLGGVQLLSIGTVGEYIGKIYLETKRRPRFIIMETTGRIPNTQAE